jgi:ATP-dependent exoDNAse (exonuclease V) beta subunit
LTLTPNQQKAVDAGNLGRDVCVVAGPGSGKTRVLVDYFELLVASGVPPSRILAITFTEKAANNMKERLAKKFAGQPVLRRELERANVSTVHGFCARMLRENAIFAGIDPEFRVLDEHEAATLQRTAVIQMLDRQWSESPEALGSILDSVECGDLGGALIRLHDAVRASGRPLGDLRSYAPPAAPGFEPLLETAARIRGFSKPGVNEQIDAVIEWAARFAHLRDGAACREHFAALDAVRINLNKLGRKNPAYEEARSFRDALDPVRRRLLTEFYAPQREIIIGLLEDFDRAYRSGKNQAGALDFADLEEAAVRLLEENAGLRERIRAQFDQVLMDEYQDTNGLQARLVDLVRPAARFFAVGDINQSIYGFRHANPDVFREFRDGVAARGGRLVDLPENFRSRAGVLDAVEALVGTAAGIERRRLIPARPFESSRADPVVEVIAAVADRVEDALEIEARSIARRIREIEGSLMLEGGPARFGQIAILVRNSEVMDTLARALEEAGVPYLVSRGKGFFETREIRDLTLLLQVLVNPLDEISLAALLRSPFAGASDEALFVLKESGTLAAGLKNPDELPLDADDRERVARFSAQLKRWRAAVDIVSFDRLMQRAIDETGYLCEPGSRAAANIEKFFALARNASGKKSLFEFVQELELLRESDPREADAPPEDSVNAVRVMTVHAAKGLEFPIVFAAALHKGVNTQIGAIAFSPRYGLGVQWRDPATGESKGDLFQRAVRDENALREQHEANRLFYVAMTRAEEHLVLSFSANGKKVENWAKAVQELFQLDLERPGNEPYTDTLIEGVPVRILCADTAPPLAAAPAASAEKPPVDVIDRPVRAAQYDSNTTVTSLNEFANCPRRYYLSRYLGWEGGRAKPLSEGAETEEADLPADLFGRQVHGLLAGEPVENPDAAAVALARSFESSDLARRVARASKVEREFDFLLAAEDIVLRGQIDLWFEEGGELVLADYKTDRIKPAEAESRAAEYGLQLRLYAQALQRLTGRAPGAAYVHFLRINRTVAVPLIPALFDDPLEIVREFREAQETQKFPMRVAARCVKCPFYRGLCPAEASATSAVTIGGR